MLLVNVIQERNKTNSIFLPFVIIILILYKNRFPNYIKIKQGIKSFYKRYGIERFCAILFSTYLVGRYVINFKSIRNTKP